MWRYCCMCEKTIARYPRRRPFSHYRYRLSFVSDRCGESNKTIHGKHKWRPDYDGHLERFTGIGSGEDKRFRPLHCTRCANHSNRYCDEHRRYFEVGERGGECFPSN